MAAITTEQQDLITELKAKLQFVQNQLSDLQAKKAIDVESANTDHRSAVDTIDATYSAQITSLQNDISSLIAQLDGVK